MARKSGLGRGLDSLIPVGIMEETEEVEREVADRKAARARAANNAGKPAAASNTANEKKHADVPKIDEETETKKKTKQALKKESPSRDTKAQADEKVKTEETSVSAQSETAVQDAAAIVPANDSISETNEVSISADPEVRTGTVSLKLTEIEPNRDQPRKEFNEDALQELADSIKLHGVIQPLLVQKKGEYYEIIAGERRWRAAKLAGIKEVPVVIREYTPREVMEVSLIENIQREDLNAIEEAKAYQRLIQEFHLKQEEIAVKISKSRTAIANTMRLLKLDERVQTMLIEDEISSGHARALLPLEDGDLQYQAAQKIASESLSVRETEKLVKLLLTPPKEEAPKEETRDDSFIYQALEEKLKTIMGTKVTIHKKDNNKGRIEIEYYSPEELERITDLMETIRQG